MATPPDLGGRPPLGDPDPAFAYALKYCYEQARRTAAGDRSKDDASDPDYMNTGWTQLWSVLIASRLPVPFNLGTPTTA